MPFVRTEKGKVLVAGTVLAGFEPVYEQFLLGFQRGQEANAQLCVYRNGKCVVDLWGTAIGDEKYGPDTLQTIFSSSKSVTAIIFATLIDRGYVSYRDRVAQHWPEFAQCGKDELRICDVLRHEAGLVHLEDTVNHKDMLIEGIKANKIGEIIERTSCVFPPKKSATRREYHALTRGFILNEIFRRADPDGRTMGEYLHDVINPSLGIDVYLGLTEEQLESRHISDLRRWTVKRVAMESLVPKTLGRKTDASSKQLLRLLRRVRQKRKESTVKRPPAVEGLDKLKTNDFIPFFNGSDIRQCETPSGNGICSARGLAKLGDVVLAGLEGKNSAVLSSSGCAALHECPIKATDYGSTGHAQHTEFTQGGLNVFRCYPEDNAYSLRTKPLREGFYGWMGLGGSVFQWHPQLNVSFAYTPTLMHWYDLQNARGARLQKKVTDCIRALECAKKDVTATV